MENTPTNYRELTKLEDWLAAPVPAGPNGTDDAFFRDKERRRQAEKLHRRETYLQGADFLGLFCATAMSNYALRAPMNAHLVINLAKIGLAGHDENRSSFQCWGARLRAWCRHTKTPQHWIYVWE